MELKKVKLKELFSIRKGKKRISEVIFNQGMIRYIQIGDLRNDNNIQYCFHKDQDIVAQKNDIIIAWDGANAGTSNYGLEGAIGSTLALLSLKQNNLYIPYIGKFIQSKFLYLRNNCTGATIPHLSRNILENLEIPLPPMDIQIKIANVLDKAQELINSKKLQLEKYDKLLQAVFMDMFGDPVTNPMGWDIKKLDDLTKVGSSTRVFTDELVSKGIPFYRGSEIGLLSEGKKIKTELYISEEHYNRIKERYEVPTLGDLLMSSICPDGKIWELNIKDPFYYKDGRVLWIKQNNEILNSKYLKNYLKISFINNYNKIASGTTFAELKIVNLKGININLPPLELQNKFASIVEKVENEKKLCEESLKQMEENFNSIMDKAFKGELF